MITLEARAALTNAVGDGIRFDVPMSRLTSLRVGGPADAVATPRRRSVLAALLRACALHRIAHHVIGGGFNVLAIDGRVRGVVVKLSRFRRLEERPGALRAEAGASHSQITRFCGERGLSGLEFGAGIPGTLGGWVAMNAGIPDRELKDALLEIEVMSPTGRSSRHLGRASLRFTDRALHGLAPGSVLLSALLRVTPADPATVRARVAEQLSRRSVTQPLNVPSCGSVFKNPPGDHAGRLIECAGLKGARQGGARITPVHANFIANEGGATAADVLALVRRARDAVRERWGFELEPEVRILGRPA